MGDLLSPRVRNEFGIDDVVVAIVEHLSIDAESDERHIAERLNQLH